MTIEKLSSDLLAPVTHGFFTRRGGASSGIFAGLNCGPGSSDQHAAVTTNRARVAAEMGVTPPRLMSLHQVHSAEAVVVGAHGWPDGRTERPRADAMVSATPGFALAILTADCAPVLLADTEAGVIGAAHAGWRGALDGVLDATLEAMVRLGARRERIAAAVGPTISQRAYEVGQEFLERFLDEDPDHSQFFTNGAGDRYLFDLPRFVLERLRGAGVGEAEWIGACTFSDPGRYYSYRRTTHAGEPDYGRLASVIVL